MKPTEFAAELAYPLTNMAIVFAMLFFWLLSTLVWNAHLFGILLGAIVFPAYLRYLLYLLEARANGRQPPVPSIEMFSVWSNTWALTPLILVAALVWGEIALYAAGLVWVAALLLLVAIIVMPLSLAVLAITHSPVESLNPMAMLRMARACGANYGLVPATMLALALIFLGLARAGVSPLVIDLGTSYQLILLFTMTGSVLQAKNIAVEVGIDADASPDIDTTQAKLDAARLKVANHAYGFVSRANREGGFAHIREWLGEEQDRAGGEEWFFREMLRWESTDAALYFGQEYLASALQRGDDRTAAKIITRCLHENPAWRPRLSDRAAVDDFLARTGRDDLGRLLGR